MSYNQELFHKDTDYYFLSENESSKFKTENILNFSQNHVHYG